METINIKMIRPDPNQPRKFFDEVRMASLKNSIKRFGVTNPIVVEKLPGGLYLLVDGERRFRVASELGLKEIPAITTSQKSPVERLVHQFHIQEQHEGWNPTEKAAALAELAIDLKVGIKEACKMLNIPETTANYYIAFASLSEKQMAKDMRLSLEMAKNLISLRNHAKKTSADDLEYRFTLTDDKNLEKAIMKKIQSGEMTRLHDFMMVKDSFTSNPKFIKKFMEEDLSIKKMYEQSGGQSAYYLRSVVNQSTWLESYINGYLKDPKISPSSSNIQLFKRTLDKFESLVSKVS